MTDYQLNDHMKNRLLTAAGCLDKLNDLHVPVNDLQLTGAVPVYRVQPCKGLKRLTNGWVRSVRNEEGRRIDLMRGTLSGCFVEWEIRK